MSVISLHTIKDIETFEAKAENISRKIIQLSQELKAGNGDLRDIEDIKDAVLELRTGIPYNDVVDERKELIVRKFEDSVNELEMLIPQRVVGEHDYGKGDDDGEDHHLEGQRSFQITYTPINAELIEQQEYESMQREIEINKIVNSVIELNSIFKDMNTLVASQGELVDNIESNIYSTVENTRMASRELNKADMWDRRRRRCNFILFVMLVIVIIIIFALIV